MQTKSLVEKLVKLMSDVHKVPIFQGNNQCKKHKGFFFKPTQSQPWFDHECKGLYAIYCKTLFHFNKNKFVENYRFLTLRKGKCKIHEHRCKRKCMY
jgi:hypothetical protein